jgi:hypothetical protein
VVTRRENCGANLTWKHPLDNSEITGNPEVIAGQKSASEKFAGIDTDKRACVYEYRVTSRVVDEQEVM